jgi:hypothetical protein
MLGGRPADALGHYRASLEVAQATGELLQIALDLHASARALARLGRDVDALEMLGLAEAHSTDIGKDRSTMLDADARAELDAAARRLGAAGALEARALGHAVAPGRRVLRAMQILDGGG